MAGLFGNLIDPVAQVQAQIDAQTKAQQAQLVNQLSAGRRMSPWATAGANIGVAFGQGLGSKIAESMGYQDPALKAAKDAAELAKGFQSLSTQYDPASAEYAAKASEFALNANRPDLALQLSQAAGERKKAEAALVAKTAQQDTENARASWSAMDTNSKLAIITQAPEQLKKLFPNMSPQDLANIQKEASATLDTIRAKNMKALNDIKPVKTNPVTAQDVKNTMSIFQINGLEPAGWRGFGTEELGSLANTFAQQAQSEQDAAGSVGTSLSLPTVQNELVQKAIETGAITTREVYGPGTGRVVTGVDQEKLSALFKERVDAYAPAKKADTKATTQKDTGAKVSEVVRQTADGRKAVFNADTKQFIRWE